MRHHYCQSGLFKKFKKTVFFELVFIRFKSGVEKKFNENHWIEFLIVHLLMQYAMRSG